MVSGKTKNIYQPKQFSFGSTSAIITNLALIIGLDTAADAKLAIISSLLVIALADNISDTLGIHMYQEAEGLRKSLVWKLTITNFFSRLITSLGFVLIVLIFPINIAVIFSLVYGFLVLAIVSYLISIKRKINPWSSIFEHLIIAVVVVILSKFIGSMVINIWKK